MTSLKERMRLRSSATSVKAKEAKENKKSVECFQCNGPHRLRNFSKKPVVKGDDGSDKAPMRLGLIVGKVEAKRKSKLVVIKRNATMELVELSERLPPRKRLNSGKVTKLAESSNRLPPGEEVSCASDLKEKIAVQTLKLGLMRFIYVESLEDLPPLGKVGYASDWGKW
ncbi:hypothetical protein J1N35_028654 [Gossypium stocksii]|uniref:Uncharacterized protein n=1 Tax=Gossypium stocksii TaxID=47602 RepID=A0A9D3ZSL1_9ROSI|nr:hypothetical protein J1N35_028654 [Gossypium stocksii]